MHMMYMYAHCTFTCTRKCPWVGNDNYLRRKYEVNVDVHVYMHYRLRRFDVADLGEVFCGDNLRLFHRGE